MVWLVKLEEIPFYIRIRNDADTTNKNGKSVDAAWLFHGLKSRGFCFEDTHITDRNKIKKLIKLLIPPEIPLECFKKQRQTVGGIF